MWFATKGRHQNNLGIWFCALGCLSWRIRLRDLCAAVMTNSFKNTPRAPSVSVGDRIGCPWNCPTQGGVHPLIEKVWNISLRCVCCAMINVPVIALFVPFSPPFLFTRNVFVLKKSISILAHKNKLQAQTEMCSRASAEWSWSPLPCQIGLKSTELSARCLGVNSCVALCSAPNTELSWVLLILLSTAKNLIVVGNLSVCCTLGTNLWLPPFTRTRSSLLNTDASFCNWASCCSNKNKRSWTKSNQQCFSPSCSSLLTSAFPKAWELTVSYYYTTWLIRLITHQHAHECSHLRAVNAAGSYLQMPYICFPDHLSM